MAKLKLELHERRWHLDPGALLPFVQSYTENLADLGHAPWTVRGYSYSIRHFAAWLCQSDVALVDVDDNVVERFARHRCQCPGNRRSAYRSASYVNRVRRFVRFLAEAGVVRVPAPQVAEAIDARRTQYLEWLRLHRGLSDRTIDYHRHMLMGLLSALGDDPAAYDASLVQQIILEKSRKTSRTYIKKMAAVLRCYLRFLEARGDCRPWLSQAVPTMAEWRLSALPRYLPLGKVEILTASCDLATPTGIRDHAILLLLARLGLRAGDVIDMRLDDVEWDEGTLRVRGKGRREVRLPLPQDVGDALLNYLNGARPSVACERIFLRSLAPYRPFAASGSISCLVSRALTRAGITDAPSQGAHQLRHSAATAMLRAGATLDTIGTVLRHRSTDTTAHYAKVDILALHQIAQPWPGDASC
jgi:integrase/recombinase XerD